MRQFLYAAVLCGLVSISLADEVKMKKNIGIFNVVKFKNDVCKGNDNKNGTCYTEEECEDKGGTASGSCAEGYGVCCIFNIGCGGSKAENITYFSSSGKPTGMCNAKVCKCQDNICQLRLDFTTFVITGPNTVSTSVGKTTSGELGSAAANEVNDVGRCITDHFSITAPGSEGIAPLCGTNTGYHMYVDASNDCNTLSFQLGASGSAMREWSIRVTQYACDYENLAPKGCLQYFFDTAGTGTLESFNRANKVHLADQNQNMCIRREAGNCKICYSHATDDFKLSTATMKNSASSHCCGYGMDGMGSDYDCVIIPDATKKDDGATTKDRQCGLMLTTGGIADKTKCSKTVPFMIRFRSDTHEYDDEVTAMGQEGFKIFYEQFREC